MARASPKKTKSPKKSSPKKATPTKARKQKKEKDPNAPKRAMSGYFFFLKENRSKLAKPGMAVTEVSKAAGAAWNALKDKSKYEKLAAADKSRYEKEKASYMKKGGKK